MWSGVYSSWILILSLTLTEQSHFQGASVTWRPGKLYPDENKTEILADFHMSWKRDSTQLNSTYCDDTDIANGKLLGDGDSSYGWSCMSGCDVKDASFDAVCVGYDEDDDWSLGSGIAHFNITGNGDFVIQLAGCCWINSLVYVSSESESWSVNISGNVGIRTDTGMPNRSPISSATPVIKFQAGCPNFVDLLVHDDDGDSVICRSAECLQSSCTLHPYLKLTQHGDKCRLSYNAGGPGDIIVAISLILEDYPQNENLRVGDVLQNSTTKLSSAEIQFLVNVYTDTGACNQKPTWISETFSNGLVKMVTTGQEAKLDLSVQSTAGIHSISVVGPEGLTKGALTGPHEDNEYTTYLALTPTSEQAGEHMICITAKDNNGKMSEQRCMILKVGDNSPCDIDNGGCDDVCMTVGQSYHCECDRECWQLADDKRTCIPAIEVRCMSDRFSFELPTCAVSSQRVTIGYSTTNDPAGPCEASSNGTYYTSEFSYEECSTRTESDFMEIHYLNKVRMWVDDVATDVGSGEEEKQLITRGYFYNMELVCSFNKYANVNATFRPQDRQENSVQVPGLGSFQFFFDFYYDEQFGAAYSPYEYPITVTVNSDIYFGIRTVGGTGLEVFTEKCVAMTTPTPTEATLSYTMIENGCLEDETMQTYATPSTMEDFFSVKAFRFQDNLNTDSSVNIYIQCSAVLCVVGEETSCQKGCIRSRKRRDGGDEIIVDRQKRSVDDENSQTTTSNISESNTIQITVSGPFRIEVERLPNTQLVTVVTPTDPPGGKDDQKPVDDDKEEEETGDSTTIIIIAASVGGACLAIILLIIGCMFAYYHFVVMPKHKIIPGDTVNRSRPNAWTDEWKDSTKEEYRRRSNEWTDEWKDSTREEHHRRPNEWTDEWQDLKKEEYDRVELPQTPPPSFWDAQSLW